VDVLISLGNLVLPYDLYERHAVVSRLLREALGDDTRRLRILDVGGRVGLLARFVPYAVCAANMDGSGDLVGGGPSLPFVRGAFAAVVSVDTVEHLPQQERLAFLCECLRVARRCVVVAAPYGGEGHRKAERQLDDLYRSVHGEPHIYLDEHVRYGLPDAAEVRGWLRDLGVTRYRIAFAGDYVWQSQQFERDAVSRRGRRASDRLWHLYQQARSWAVFHPVRLEDQVYPTANRFYLLIKKGG
jgi:hypothetical protein